MLKNHYKAILFDLDGTLLPMDMDEFTNGYFKELYKAVNPEDIPIKTFVDAIWKGTYSMMTNDGKKTNRDAFWDTFGSLTGCDVDDMDRRCLSFYSSEFKLSKCFTKDNPLARKAVQIARKKADKDFSRPNVRFLSKRTSCLNDTSFSFKSPPRYFTVKTCEAAGIALNCGHVQRS